MQVGVVNLALSEAGGVNLITPTGVVDMAPAIGMKLSCTCVTRGKTTFRRIQRKKALNGHLIRLGSLISERSRTDYRSKYCRGKRRCTIAYMYLLGVVNPASPFDQCDGMSRLPACCMVDLGLQFVLWFWPHQLLWCIC